MRAIFQIIAFSFLIVTLLMLINLKGDFWHRTLALLIAKHCLNLLAYTIDLVAFSLHKLSLLKYKFILDAFSIVMIIAIQVKLFTGDSNDTAAEGSVAPSDGLS